MGDEKDDKYDLTSLTELGEFLHELDPEVDSQLEHGAGDQPSHEEEDEVAENEFNEFRAPMPESLTEESAASEESFGNAGFEDSESEETSFTDDNANFGDDSFQEDNQALEDTAEFGETSFEDTTLDSDEASEFEESSFEDTDSNSEQDQEFLSTDSFEQDFSESEHVEQDESVPDQFDQPEAETEDIEQEDSNTGPMETPVAQPPAAPEPGPAPAIKSVTTAPETFEDVKSFSEKMSYGLASGNGNPPFSIILSNIKYKEDVNEILSILKEHGIANESNESDFIKGLENGQALISQLSEYVAIVLGVKFKKYDLDIKLGLSQEIHPTDSYSHNLKGLVSKENLNQNHKMSLNLEELIISPDDVLVTTTSDFEGYQINRYISIITDNMVLHEQDLADYATEPPLNDKIDLSSWVDESFEYSAELSHAYESLLDKLKLKAAKLKGNALVGISFQMHPLSASAPKYHLTCTGNLVWVTPIKNNDEINS